MEHMNKTITIAAAVLAAAVTLPASATADDTAAANAPETRIVTDFRGSPPFKRRIVTVSDTAEKAAREAKPAAAEPDESERVLVVERRGAPPYKRRFVTRDEVEVAEFARFEETNEARDTRRGPPGKLTTRR